MQKSKVKNDVKDVVVVNDLNKESLFTVTDNQQKTFLIFLTEGKDQEGEVKIVIKGEKARVQILGIIIGFGSQKIRLYTLQDHKKPESISDLYVKSVLFGSAQLHYEGLINIDRGAQKSNAYQKNANLLLSSKALAFSRPYLEILANDVRCTHGATIGKINKDQLYYLQTRGFSVQKATQLLTEGFFAEIVEKIPDKKTQNFLTEQIKAKIENLLKKEDNLWENL